MILSNMDSGFTAILAPIWITWPTACFTRSHSVCTGSHPACNSLYELAFTDGQHGLFCAQVSEAVIMMTQPLVEYDQQCTDTIWWKSRTNGKCMFALRQKVSNVALVTDVTFTPLRHDQISVPFFCNSFSASAPPPGAPRGRNRCYQQDCFYPPPQSSILLPVAWWWEDRKITPHAERKLSLSTLRGQTCSCPLRSALSNPVHGSTVTMVATVTTNWRQFIRHVWCLSNRIVGYRWATICGGRCL